LLCLFSQLEIFQNQKPDFFLQLRLQ
jgi:hypothetical protein